MTDFIGIVCTGPKYLLGSVLTASPMPDLGIKQSNGAGIGDYPASYGAVTDNDMGAQADAAHAGVKVPTYGDMFYGRVYINPLTIALGRIFSEQSIEVIVFNGYMDASRIFESISFDGADGINLSTGGYDAPPVAMAPLQELHYAIVVSMEGPASIDCTITWNFEDNTADADTVITGSRVLVWPLTFKRNLTETLEWQTDVLTGDNGTEQRISLRLSPRQTYKITSRVPNSYRATMDNLLYGWRHRIWGFPVWTESTKLTDVIAVGDTTISMDTSYADYSIGGRVLIYKDMDTMFVGTIADIGDTYLEIEEDITKSFTTSDKAMPLKSSIIKQDPEQYSHGGKKPEISATFLLTDLTTVEESTPASTYDDIDVETERPLLSGGDVDDTWERDMTVYDFGPGVRRELSTWDYTRKARSYTRILKTRADIWATRQWLMRRRGKAVPFYQPTYQEDLVLTDLDGDIGDLIICTGNYHPTMGSDRINLAFFMTDGSVLLREITGAEASTNGTMTLSLDSSIDMARADILHISYMGCKRMTSDSIEITWKRTDLAELDYSITEIRP